MGKFQELINSLAVEKGGNGSPTIGSKNLDLSPLRGEYFNLLKASNKDDNISDRIFFVYEFILGTHFDSNPEQLKKGLLDIFLFPLLNRNLLYFSKQKENTQAKRIAALAGFVILESLRFTLAAALMIVPSLMIIFLHTIYNVSLAIKNICSALSYLNIAEECKSAKKGIKMQLQSVSIFKHEDDSEKYAQSSEELVVLSDKQTTPPTNNY